MDIFTAPISRTMVVLMRPYPVANRSSCFRSGSPNGFLLPFHPLYPNHKPLVAKSFQAKQYNQIRALPVVKASMREPSSSPSNSPGSSIAPLQLNSPVGQFLHQILLSHPHLVPAAVEQQLEQLQTDRETEKQNEEAPPSSTDLVLYRRIAEVKENDRKKALEEILYALVVQRFINAEVPLIPSIATEISGKVDSLPIEDKTFENLHSIEANEMIQNHLVLILGNRAGESSTIAQISKFRIGQVYAASIMYGYFLKRVDQRFQLEKSMKLLQSESPPSDGKPTKGEDPLHLPSSHPEAASNADGWSSGFGLGMKASRLRNYVMSLDGETLQNYATLRSKEAVSLIERHTEALFGRPEIIMPVQGNVGFKEEHVSISFAGLKRLVLEAVTFGAFLWDVESYVDSRYHFIGN